MGVVIGDTWYSDYAVATNSPIYQMGRDMQRAAQAEQQAAEKERNQIASNAREVAQVQANSALEAARIKAASADKATALQEKQYEESKGINQQAVSDANSQTDAWRLAGLEALEKLQGKLDAGPGEFTEDPGYQFRLQEGQKALERSAAARGGLLSGATGKGLVRYGQDFATQEYDNFLKRYYDSLAPLQQMSGVGVNTGQAQGRNIMQGASNITNAGQNTTNAIAQNTIYGGESTASGITDYSNVIAAMENALTDKDYSYAAWKYGENF